jgi:hypothetical protein
MLFRRFRSSTAEHGAESIMPVSYLGTEGILNGLSGERRQADGTTTCLTSAM